MVTATPSPTEIQQSIGSIGKPAFMLVYLLLLLSMYMYLICFVSLNGHGLKTLFHAFKVVCACIP